MMTPPSGCRRNQNNEEINVFDFLLALLIAALAIAVNRFWDFWHWFNHLAEPSQYLIILGVFVVYFGWKIAKDVVLAMGDVIEGLEARIEALEETLDTLQASKEHQ
jgi:hypothetical protein